MNDGDGDFGEHIDNCEYSSGGSTYSDNSHYGGGGERKNGTSSEYGVGAKRKSSGNSDCGAITVP